MRYSLRLVPVAGNSLMFAEEKLEFLREGAEKPYSRLSEVEGTARVY